MLGRGQPYFWVIFPICDEYVQMIFSFFCACLPGIMENSVTCHGKVMVILSSDFCVNPELIVAYYLGCRNFLSSRGERQQREDYWWPPVPHGHLQWPRSGCHSGWCIHCREILPGRLLVSGAHIPALHWEEGIVQLMITEYDIRSDFVWKLTASLQIINSAA